MNFFRTLTPKSAGLGLRLTLTAMLLAAATAVSRPANAGIVITATETGGNVIISYAGSLDLRGFHPINSIQENTSSIVAGNYNNTDGPVMQFHYISGGATRFFGAFDSAPTSIGTSSSTTAAFATHPSTVDFGIGPQDSLYLESTLANKPSYDSQLHTGLFGESFYENQSFSSLGLDVGSYTWVLKGSADTIVFNVGDSAVPEPSTAIAMGLLGIVGFAGNRRRRRQELVA